LPLVTRSLPTPPIVGLARLVHPTHSKAAFWGCVLSLMGFVGYGGLDGIDYVNWVAGKPDTGLDPNAMQALIEEALHTNAILIPILLVFTLLPIGLGVLAVGLSHAGVMPSWLAALMPIGMAGRLLPAVSRRPRHLRSRPTRQLRLCRCEAAARSERVGFQVGPV
jgi:hypothetical protein